MGTYSRHHPFNQDTSRCASGQGGRKSLFPKNTTFFPNNRAKCWKNIGKLSKFAAKYLKRKKLPLREVKKAPPFPNNDEGSHMPLGRCEEELRSDLQWAETLCMNTRAAGNPDFFTDKFAGYLRRFFAKLENEGVTSKPPDDAKAHFARWLKIELEKQKRNETHRNPYWGKQEANDYALQALQERMEQRRSGLQDELPKPF